MSASEFQAWMVFSAVEPFGSQWDDFRFGQVATAAASAWGARVKPSDFFPTLAVPRKKGAAAHPGGLLSLCPALTPIDASAMPGRDVSL